MIRLARALALLLLLALPRLAAQSVAFDGAEEGRRRIREHDEFFQRMTPFDRMARLKTNGPVTERQLADFMAGTVREWDAKRRAKVQAAWDAILPALKRLALPLPATVHLVHATGAGEGNAAYTRGDAVFLPTGDIDKSPDLARLLAHELFHVASRADAAMRDRAYAAIGFEPCGEVALPKALRGQGLTNPDAPINRHAIRVTLDGRDAWVVPVIYSSVATFDPKAGGEFFDHLESKLMVVDRTASGTRPAGGDAGRLVSFDDAKGFHEKAGRNTGYTIHPEEILADNFAMLATGATGARSPEVLERVRRAIPAR